MEKFVFIFDFVVHDIDENDNTQIILGRPFLRTTRALVDINESKQTLRVGSKKMTFRIVKVMKFGKVCDNKIFLKNLDNEEVLEENS